MRSFYQMYISAVLIKDHADQEIARQLREGKIMDEEDAERG